MIGLIGLCVVVCILIACVIVAVSLAMPTRWYVVEVQYSDGDIRYALMARNGFIRGVMMIDDEKQYALESANRMNRYERKPVKSGVIHD
jgi:hypothetical protein